MDARQDLGQQPIVANKPGAGTNVANGYVAKSAPDGYTLLMNAVDPITAQADHFVAVLDGQTMVDTRHDKHRAGPIALQSAVGTIHCREVQIRTL